MGRSAVILLHESPEEATHFDLMLLSPEGSAGDPERRDLATFRLGERLDLLGAGNDLEGERIGDHRNRYLDFEGDIGRGRGRVQRVAAGEVEWVRFGPDSLEARIEWVGGPAMTIRAAHEEGDRWRIARIV